MSPMSGSATEAVTAAIERLQALHERTNCVAAWNEAALAVAAARDEQESAGPLHGVPYTVKDWIDAAGLPCTGGYVESRARVPDRDASVVARMNAAGAVLIAKTAVQVDSELFGPVRNPHDPQRSPGASSSGEAVAVGGGAVRIGLGSDSGGSIRVPAAWCGAAGLKPTAGRVPATGHFPRVGGRADGRTQIGPIAATVDELDAVLRVIAGPDGIDPDCPPVPLSSAPIITTSAVRVRIVRGDGAAAGAVERACDALGAAGAHLAGEAELELGIALEITERYWNRGRRTGAEAGRQLADWDRYRRRMERTDADLVVMPATPGVAPVHRPMESGDYLYCLPASLTGWPAAVVPVTSVDGLPVGVQVMARAWRDDVALHAARVIETHLRP